MEALQADGIRLDLLRQVNLNHLVSFLAVAELRNFRAAADALYVSQSPLSVQVQQLEEALGVSLFRRNTRSVVLTREGERLLPAARLATAELACIVGDFREEAALHRGTASIAAIPSTMSSLLPPVLKILAERYPNIVANVTVLSSSNAVADSVRRGTADVGLLNFDTDLNELKFTKLFDDAFVAVVPRSKTWLTDREEVALSDLVPFPMLAQPVGTSIRAALDAQLHEQRLTASVRLEILHVATLVELVGVGLGVAVLPQEALAPLQLGACRVLKLHGVRPRQVGIALSQRRSVSPAVMLIRRLIQELQQAQS